MSSKTGQGASALDDVRTKEQAETSPARDSPKRHGDKLGSGAAAQATAKEAAAKTGDSPKRQGDELAHAVREAGKP